MKLSIIFFALTACGLSLPSFAATNKILSGVELITQPVAFDSKILFTAKDAAHGQEIWVSDGTSAGTKLIKDITPGADNSSNYWNYSFDEPTFTVLGNRAVFTRRTQNYVQEVWVTDGTSEGTSLLKSFDIQCSFGDMCDSDEYTYNYSSEIYGFIAVGNRAFFFVNSASGHEIWATDGTSAGTYKAYKLASNEWFIAGAALQGKYYLQLKRAADQSYYGPKELWVIDPSISSVNYLMNLDSPYGLNIYATDNRLFYADGNYQIGLVDLENATSSVVLDTQPDSFGGGYDGVATVAGNPVFKMFDELWISDGTLAGSAKLLTTNSYKGISSNGDVAIINDFDQLYLTKGAAAAAKKIDTTSGFFIVGNNVDGENLYYLKRTSNGSTELWYYNQTNDSIVQAEKLNSNNGDKLFTAPTKAGNNLFMLSGPSDDNDPSELWVKKLTGNGTSGNSNSDASNGSSGGGSINWTALWLLVFLFPGKKLGYGIRNKSPRQI